MTSPSQGRETERAYRITWRGESYVLSARSRSAARYASWLAFKEAGYRADLPTFARMIEIRAERGTERLRQHDCTQPDRGMRQ